MSDEMAQFAAQFLNEGFAGMRIHGFGPDQPPPPSIDPEDLKVVGPPSPLAAIAPKPTGTTASVPTTTTIVNYVPPDAPIPDLVVINGAACYRGNNADLNDREQKAIAQIVLKAMVKRAREQYQAVASQITKRAYRRKNAEAEAGSGGGVRGRGGRRKGGDGKRKGAVGSGGVQGSQGDQPNPAPVGEAGEV